MAIESQSFNLPIWMVKLPHVGSIWGGYAIGLGYFGWLKYFSQWMIGYLDRKGTYIGEWKGKTNEQIWLIEFFIPKKWMKRTLGKERNSRRSYWRMMMNGYR